MLASICAAGELWATRAPVAGHPASLIEILTDELGREYAALKEKGDPPPYYMAYAVTDERTDSEIAYPWSTRE